jgi:hypothetical protein
MEGFVTCPVEKLDIVTEYDGTREGIRAQERLYRIVHLMRYRYSREWEAEQVGRVTVQKRAVCMSDRLDNVNNIFVAARKGDMVTHEFEVRWPRQKHQIVFRQWHLAWWQVSHIAIRRQFLEPVNLK